MVSLTLTDLRDKIIDGIRGDIDAFFGAFAKHIQPRAGLYTYRLLTTGGKLRLHLRIDIDGSGVLFVDVTDVIHLNPTAARMAKLALDEVPYARARAIMQSEVPATDRRRLTTELQQIYDMVDRLKTPGAGCPTCSVDALERAPLFSQRAQAPYKADLALTYGCNNQCGHCYNEPDRFTMPSLSQKHWFDIIDKLMHVGVPHVIFTGGEATLHPDLTKLIAYADSMGMVTGLNTNGRRMAKLSYSQELAQAGLNHVQVTLGSSRPAVHDSMMGAASFNQTVQGIRNALASHIHCITNTTLMRCNMDHVEEIIDFLYDLGIRTFAMNGMIYSGGGYSDPNAIPEQELPPLLVRVRDHAAQYSMRFLWYTPTEYCRMSPVELELGAKRCNAGEYSICIEPNGDVLPCQSYYVSAGNILSDRWEDIWRSELFRSFRDRENDPAWAGLPEKCWHCPDLTLCGGGCRIEREAREGHRVVESASAGCAVCTTGRSRGEPDHSFSTVSGYIPPAGAATRKIRSNGGNSSMIKVAEYHE